MINFVVQIHKILTKNTWNWNNIFGYIIVRSILDERLEQAERQILHETSHQSRRSEKRSIKNSSSSSSSSNSSLEESKEMELEINPSDALSSHEFYQKYKESVGREKFANSKVLDKHNISWILDHDWLSEETHWNAFHLIFLILKPGEFGTKQRVSKRTKTTPKTANGPIQKTITREVHTTYSERSELQSALNIGTVGRKNSNVLSILLLYCS